MPFNEIVKSIHAELYDRAVSPLMGSFTISWSAINYKFILLIFADLDILEKFDLINNELYTDLFTLAPNNPALMLFIYPVLTALAYIFVYPKAAKPIFEYARKRQKEISDIKKEIDGDTLLTLQESRNIKSEIYKLEELHLEELNRKDTEIEKLQKQLEKTKQSIKPKNNKQKDKIENPQNKELPDDQVQILKAFINKDSNIYEKKFIDIHRGSEVSAKHAIGELVNNSYIEEHYDSYGNGLYYNLTHKGRSYIVDKKLDNIEQEDSIPF